MWNVNLKAHKGILQADADIGEQIVAAALKSRVFLSENPSVQGTIKAALYPILTKVRMRNFKLPGSPAE